MSNSDQVKIIDGNMIAGITASFAAVFAGCAIHSGALGQITSAIASISAALK